MTINCKGKLTDLSIPVVMGILNITPDSFYDGGKHLEEKEILSHAEKMLLEGATFIDLGAYSSRPGAAHIGEEEELKRILPATELILKHFPEALLSIDTFRNKIAKTCIEAGACMVNDISSGHLDPMMLPTVAELQVPYIMMHMKGTPQNMQENPTYENIMQEMISYFSERIRVARSLGINDLILDPGFGFSKNLQHNNEVLRKMDLLSFFELPILAGLSRKSMIYKPLEITAAEALNGTTVLNTISLLHGARILRVHDVAEAVQAIKLCENLGVFKTD